jgi:hypothetical protein
LYQWEARGLDPYISDPFFFTFFVVVDSLYPEIRFSNIIWECNEKKSIKHIEDCTFFVDSMYIRPWSLHSSHQSKFIKLLCTSSLERFFSFLFIFVIIPQTILGQSTCCGISDFVQSPMISNKIKMLVELYKNVNHTIAGSIKMW